MFGINRLRSDELLYFGAKEACLGAFVQLLCNRDGDDFSTKVSRAFVRVE
jgi:hypothetical protein